MTLPVVGANELSGFESEEFAPEDASRASHLPEWAPHVIIALAIPYFLPVALIFLLPFLVGLDLERVRNIISSLSERQFLAWELVNVLGATIGMTALFLGTKLLTEEARSAAGFRTGAKRVPPNKSNLGWLPWEPRPISFSKSALISVESAVSIFAYVISFLSPMIVFGLFCHEHWQPSTLLDKLSASAAVAVWLTCFSFAGYVLKSHRATINLLMKDTLPEGAQGAWIWTLQVPPLVGVNSRQLHLSAGEGRVEFGDQAMSVQATFSSRASSSFDPLFLRTKSRQGIPWFFYYFTITFLFTTIISFIFVFCSLDGVGHICHLG